MSDTIVHVIGQINSEGQRIITCCGIEGRAVNDLIPYDSAFPIVVDAHEHKQLLVGLPNITVIQETRGLPRGSRHFFIRYQRDNVCKACAESYYAAATNSITLFREEEDMSKDEEMIEDSSYPVNREGTRLYDNWNYSNARLARAKEEFEKAEASYRDAEQKLGKWIMPDDATTGECIAVWFEDRLIVTEIQYNSLWRVGDPHTYKIKSRPRKRVAAPEALRDEPLKSAGGHPPRKPSNPDEE
jgi:hypothetical protein